MIKFPIVKILVLSCIKPEQTDSFRNHVAWFRCCVQRYNAKSQLSTINKKKIEIISVNDKNIQIKLFCETNLQKAPGRALIMLSNMLITMEEEYKEEYDAFFEENLFHGKLFTIREIKNDAMNSGVEITDADIVKALVDYIVTPKHAIAEYKKQAFEEIRRIVIENNML